MTPVQGRSDDAGRGDGMDRLGAAGAEPQGDRGIAPPIVWHQTWFKWPARMARGSL